VSVSVPSRAGLIVTLGRRREARTERAGKRKRGAGRVEQHADDLGGLARVYRLALRRPRVRASLALPPRSPAHADTRRRTKTLLYVLLSRLAVELAVPIEEMSAHTAVVTRPMWMKELEKGLQVSLLVRRAE
jgi:hypothetical protein